MARVNLEVVGQRHLMPGEGSLPDLEQFKPVCARFMDGLSAHLLPFAFIEGPLDLVGFSQGTAMCYALALLYPQRFKRIAALSGFMPDLPLDFDWMGLREDTFFVAHGVLDETIPVESARRLADFMEKAGANVTYCEDAVGHKLGPSCFRGLAAFFSTPLG